jgi:hypothetical protein
LRAQTISDYHQLARDIIAGKIVVERGHRTIGLLVDLLEIDALLFSKELIPQLIVATALDAAQIDQPIDGTHRDSIQREEITHLVSNLIEK